MICIIYIDSVLNLLRVCLSKAFHDQSTSPNFRKVFHVFFRESFAKHSDFYAKTMVFSAGWDPRKLLVDSPHWCAHIPWLVQFVVPGLDEM